MVQHGLAASKLAARRLSAALGLMSTRTSNKPTSKGVGVRSPDARSEAAIKSWVTRRSPRYRAAKSEKSSKTALSEWCQENGWKVVFFEGPSGSPRTGIVDAVIVRIKPRDPDAIEVRLVQLKSGVAGLTGAEVARLKKGDRVRVKSLPLYVTVTRQEQWPMFHRS